MQFCTTHWQALRQAVECRGMSHLVAKDGAAAIQDVAAQFNGTDTLANWDPLMAAHWAIGNRVLQAVGLRLIVERECPLCVVERSGVQQTSNAGAAQQWVDGCMDSMLAYARQNKLVAEVQ